MLDPRPAPVGLGRFARRRSPTPAPSNRQSAVGYSQRRRPSAVLLDSEADGPLRVGEQASVAKKQNCRSPLDPDVGKGPLNVPSVNHRDLCPVLLPCAWPSRLACSAVGPFCSGQAPRERSHHSAAFGSGQHM